MKKDKWIYLKLSFNEYDDFKAAALAAVIFSQAALFTLKTMYNNTFHKKRRNIDNL